MNDEKMRILRMLENGKINADEAERLLKAISQDKGEDFGFLNHILKTVGSYPGKTGEIYEEFIAEKVYIKLKAASLIIKESDDENFRIYGNGSIKLDKRKKDSSVEVFGSMKMEIPDGSKLSIKQVASDLKGTLGVPVELDSKMSNTEINVKNSVSINLEAKMSNISLSFFEPVNMKFDVKNRLGSISSSFKLNKIENGLEGMIGKGPGTTKIKAKLSNVELLKVKEE